MLEVLLSRIYNNKQIIKYVISGAMAAFVDLSLLVFFTDILKIWYLYSTSIAFVFAFFISFYLQKFWTFRDGSKKIIGQMSVYFFVGIMNLIFNAGMMYVWVDKLGIYYLLAQIITGALIGISSFLIYQLFIFKKVKAEKRKENGEIRVLIATGIFPPDIGGPATMLKALINFLLESGFSIKVITYASKGRYEKINFGNKVIKIKRINFNYGALVKHFLYLRHLLEMAKWSDIIYATDIYSVGYFSYLAKRILHKKYIIRFAGDSAWETAVSNGWTSDYIVDFQNKTYNKKIEKLKNRRKKILMHADQVIVVSNFMAELARMIGVEDKKIKVIYNSVDFMDKVEVATDDVEEIKNKYASGKIITTSCRLTPWKGVDGIIKIIPKLREKVGNINFLVLGDGPELKNLENLAIEFGVEDSVHFLGRIKHEETIKYFLASDLYILNTNYEGLSHALLDVMKSSTPIVTTNVGGNPELINNGKEGILVSYNNEKELLDASIKILTDKEFAKKISEAAFEKVKKFNWEEVGSKTVSLLKKAVL